METTNVGFKTKTSSVDPFMAGLLDELSKESKITRKEWDREYHKYTKRLAKKKPPEYKKTMPHGAAIFGLMGAPIGAIRGGGKGALLGAGIGALAGTGIAALATRTTRKEIERAKVMTPAERTAKARKVWKGVPAEARETLLEILKEQAKGKRYG